MTCRAARLLLTCMSGRWCVLNARCWAGCSWTLSASTPAARALPCPNQVTPPERGWTWDQTVRHYCQLAMAALHITIMGVVCGPFFRSQCLCPCQRSVEAVNGAPVSPMLQLFGALQPLRPSCLPQPTLPLPVQIEHCTRKPRPGQRQARHCQSTHMCLRIGPAFGPDFAHQKGTAFGFYDGEPFGMGEGDAPSSGAPSSLLQSV